MNNFSEVTHIHLSEYYGMEDQKPVYFCMFLIIYIIIVAENILLIGVVYSEKTLHEPMFILLSNLAVNSLYGSTAILPALLSNLVSDSYEISLALCQTQIYVIHTYIATEFTILAVMSYDRYVAICYPLLYHTIMSQRVVKLIAFTWIYPMLAFLIVFIFTLRLRLCERTIDKVYCINYSLVKLACADTDIVNIVGLVSATFFVIPQVIMIFYTYAHILRICVSSFRESKLKAFRTCTPHLFAITNYSIGCLFEMAQSRFKMSHLSYQSKLFLSLYFLIFPPILNLTIYGLSIQAIRVQLLRLFSIKRRHVANNVAGGLMSRCIQSLHAAVRTESSGNK